MSETPAPYNPKGKKLSDMERVAKFMNGDLSLETLEELPCPENIDKDYDDMNAKEKREWVEYTFNELFRMASLEVFSVLGRGANALELNLMKRRIVNYFKNIGIEYEK